MFLALCVCPFLASVPELGLIDRLLFFISFLFSVFIQFVSSWSRLILIFSMSVG